MQLEIEREALKRETDAASKDRLEQARKGTGRSAGAASTVQAQWQTEKGGLEKLSKIKSDIEQTRREIEKAKREYDLNKVAELQYGKLAESRKGTGRCGRAADSWRSRA